VTEAARSATKSPGRGRGLTCVTDRSKASVAGRDRSFSVGAEAVVEPQRNHIHVLANPVERAGENRIYDRERVVSVTHKEMIVFDADRLVRREAILPTDSNGAAPACRAYRRQTDAVQRRENIETIARDRRTALEVQQRRVPGVTDLAGE